MSKATKRKIVAREVLDQFVLPEGNQCIVKVTASKGNNLHEVETSLGEKYLASMPTKFRKNVWIKRGDFVIVEPIEEGDKVKAEIIFVLYKDQIKYIKEEGLWPVEFGDARKEKSAGMIPEELLPPSDPDSSDEDYDADLVMNMNRVKVSYEESEEESSDNAEEENDKIDANVQEECATTVSDDTLNNVIQSRC